MSDNIKFHPKSYNMSDELKRFFGYITDHKEVQKQLYVTKKISDVALIAKELGFDVTAAEVLQAQAGRVLAILEEGTDDIQRLLSGEKPKTGVQWGRGGGGFLDRAGYWLSELSNKPAQTEHKEMINGFLEKAKQDEIININLQHAKTFNDLQEVFQSNGVNINATELLAHQAQTILTLNETEAEELAHH